MSARRAAREAAAPFEPPGPGLFDEIRSACAEVARRARMVRIDDAALDRFAAHLASLRPTSPSLDPARPPFADARTGVAFVLTLDAINFGSGWFPHLRKPAGSSGYRTIAGALRRRFERDGALSARELETIDASRVARLLDQPLEPPLDELLRLFAQAWNDLGALVARDYDGRFVGLAESARGRAVRLVATLARMPLYRDVARYQELTVPFYKRAQITCADLMAQLEGKGVGSFEDAAQLTLFADNLVPHVLRMLGILVYDGQLLLRIGRGHELASGSEEEVEIRAAAVHAVERLAGSCARRGWPVPVHRLDALLWTRGQDERMKAEPRHRTRCPYY